MATSSRSNRAAATRRAPPTVRPAGTRLDSDTWTGTDAFARAGLPTIKLQAPTHDSAPPVLLTHADNPQGAEFHPDTATLVGLETEARETNTPAAARWRRPPALQNDPLGDLANFQGNDLLVLRDYKLKEQDQRDRRSLQGAVLLGIISLIVLTLVLVVVAVGIKAITEGFGEHIISLVLTAALSGLGGAVAWAFRGTSPDSTPRTKPKPRTR